MPEVPLLYTPPSFHRVAASTDPRLSPGIAALVGTGHSECWADQTAGKASVHTIPGRDTPRRHMGTRGTVRHRQPTEIRHEPVSKFQASVSTT